MEEKKSLCGCSCGNFPTFAVIVLLLGISWLLKDLGMINFDIPWLPILVIVISLSWIIGHYNKKQH